VGVDPLLEGEVRGGEVEYSRARLRLGRTRSFGAAQAATVLELAATSIDAPLDALPAIDRDIVPWLATGTSARRFLAAAGADAAVPIVLNGHARVRIRALAGAAEAGSLSHRSAWRFGGEIGAIWPTVLGPISVGAAAGQRSDWRFNIAVGADF
jgi:hypothetical protein